MKILNSNNSNFNNKLDILLKNRFSTIDIKIENEVKRIIHEVKKNGDTALFKFSKKFDNIKLNNKNILISKKIRKEAISSIDKKSLKAFKLAIKNITSFHKKQFPKNYMINNQNIIKGIKWKPIESVGLYVPGGKAVYPSSLIMNVVPAKVAKVKRIVVVTPGSKKGINPYLLALLEIFQIDEAYQIGGAQAIAALAYGTNSIKPVNKIFGPGNAYIASAKKQVYGKVGIDLIAGPSEIVVVADDSNNPDWVAADMIAQAEHDENAQSILITNSQEFASKVISKIKYLSIKLPKKNIIEKSLNNFGAVIILNDIVKASSIINLIAPEHLHLQSRFSNKIFKNIKNAGCIFLGEYSCEAYGDYIAGTNHILPTSGSSKFSSGLGVNDFMKKSSYLKINKKSSYHLEKYVSQMATIEKLEGHKLSVKVRQKQKK